MNVTDKIALAFKYILNKKISSLFFLFFIIILLFAGHISINISYNFNKYIKDFINKDMAGRTLFVSEIPYSTKPELEIMDHKHIIYTYNPTDLYLIAKTSISDKNNTLNIAIKPIMKGYYPNLISGKIATKENEIICPKYLTNGTTKEELIDISKYLDKEINISYDKIIREDIDTIRILKTFKKDITITGIYTNAISHDSYTECYMDAKYLKTLVEESKEEYSNLFKETTTVTDDWANIAIVDEVKNVDSTIKQLTESGYSVTRGYDIDYNYINIIKKISYICLIIVLILLLTISIIYINNIIKKDKINLGIMKVSGYKNKDISSIVLYKILIIIFLGYIVSFILTIITKNITQKLISNYLKYSFIELEISLILEFAYLLFIFSIIVLTSMNITKKIYKLEVRKILNENN